MSRAVAFLLLLSLLALSPLSSARACTIPYGWSTSSSQSYTQVAALIGDSSQQPCQVVAVNTTQRVDDQSARIEGFDVATGERQWSWMLSDGLDGHSWDVPIVGIPSNHLFSLTAQNGPCGALVRLYNITRVAYDRSSGLKAAWSTSLGCVGTYEETFVFPATGSPQLGDEQPELLLSVADIAWLSLNGASGELLHRENVTSYAVQGEVAILGDGTAHRFIAMTAQSEDEMQVVAYQLHNDGRWTALANSSFDPSVYSPPMATAMGDTGASRGEVLVLQHQTRMDELYGLNLLTGQKVWSASGYALLTGAWAKSHSNYTAGVSSLDPHPTRSDWLLITAVAYNETEYIIFQFGLVDSTTGKLVATSAVTEPEYYGGGYGWFMLWDVVDDGGVLIRRLQGTSLLQRWVALNSTTLETVSSGILPVSKVDDVTFVDAQPGSVSLITTDGIGRMQGKRVMADGTDDRVNSALVPLFTQRATGRHGSSTKGRLLQPRYPQHRSQSVRSARRS